ncbi:hypothetical protein GF373_03065 [bacterium]|nr:hypothetical protein [bacterium]
MNPPLAEQAEAAAAGVVEAAVITDKRNKAAFALIVILWIVAIMGTITMLFTRKANLTLKISRNVNQSIKAELLAEAGIYKTIADLVLDKEESMSDNATETWYDNQEANFDVPLGDGVYRIYHPNAAEVNSIRYGAWDECSKLNMNTATREMLLRLPQADPEIIDPLLDWRDEDENPREFGAEDEYYQSLEEPFITKNALFDTVDELMLVKNMTVSILYGEDLNINGILDANENDGEQNYPIDNGDGQLDRGWHPYITCYSYETNEDSMGESRVNVNSANNNELRNALSETLSNNDINAIVEARDEEEFESIADVWAVDGISRDEFKKIADKITVSDEDQLQGRVNINTAPSQVLQCLLGEENQEIVEAIIEYRQSSEGPFESIGQLLDVDGINQNQFSQMANSICTKSSVFSIRAAGYIEESKTYKEVYAIVDRGEDPPKIRYWKVIR